MAFPAPDYFSGSQQTRKLADAIFSTAGWIRRRCNEILAEADLDVVKVYDLGQQCRIFREHIVRVLQAGEVTVILEALTQLIREEGVGRPNVTTANVNAETKALYAAAGVFSDVGRGQSLAGRAGDPGEHESRRHGQPDVQQP